jgi:mxaD protein
MRRSLLSLPFVVALVVLAASLSRQVSAHGPTPQKVEETIEIAAPPGVVWGILKDFGAISAWHPQVAKSEGKGGNAAGGERTITLKSGGNLVDGIDEFNDKDMNYSYRLSKENIASFPVSFYSATISVKPAAKAGSSEVDWIGRFYRADTGNEPPEDKNDAAAIAAMKNFLSEGLKGLKSKAEKG